MPGSLPSPADAKPHFSSTRIEGISDGSVCATTRVTGGCPKAHAHSARTASGAKPKRWHSGTIE